MKKSLYFLFLFLPLFLLLSCGDDSTNPTSATNPYSGKWQIIFAGDYVGAGNMNIDDNGDFAVTVLLNTITNTVSGNVSEQGKLSAKIYYAGDEIGIVSGTMTTNSGSGTWETSTTYGTWSATRKE